MFILFKAKNYHPPCLHTPPPIHHTPPPLKHHRLYQTFSFSTLHLRVHAKCTCAIACCSLARPPPLASLPTTQRISRAGGEECQQQQSSAASIPMRACDGTSLLDHNGEKERERDRETELTDCVLCERKHVLVFLDLTCVFFLFRQKPKIVFHPRVSLFLYSVYST